MGACEFYSVGSGNSVKDAFDLLRQNMMKERDDHGYTGTIAEKTSYKQATSEVFASLDEAKAFVLSTIDDESHWCNNKYGPAAYVIFMNNNEKKYVFFGLAPC